MSILQNILNELTLELTPESEYTRYYTGPSYMDVVATRMVALPSCSKKFIVEQLKQTLNPHTDMYVGPLSKESDKFADSISPKLARFSIGRHHANCLRGQDLSYVKRVFIDFQGMYFQDHTNHNKRNRTIMHLYSLVDPEAIFIIL
ncbi:hypothetical protein Acj133p128 [Acinetobacter phage 133]|uniref:Uncharacterized protein n=1 Tax=Acinetobacter phage 133 TaxID=2919552 RepID=D9I662_9CAUD|nr:hypothetical protein Acj133p128 [Acinetobacter phage 133]ADJ19443.1 hypothetical protein Acj133p128 [Acinetobacter phage 133]